mmetsp:Transcript_114/g.208  ORF Transcript_114/g.208 Transcript_114/m.208 type:complete len:442 (-) Transcript_114:174-1499(-)
MKSAGEPAHGVGDRNTYYNKWDKFAKESVSEIENEEAEIKKQLEQQAAGTPVSLAEKKDLEKREALKEAKKMWDGVSASQEASKVIVEDEKDLKQRVLEFDTQSRRVLVLKNNSDCHYYMPHDQKLVKLFVEGCSRCKLHIDGSLVTSTVEISRCEDITISFMKQPTHTVQVDMSSNVTVYYAERLFDDNCKVYHSGVRNLRVDYDHVGDGNTKYQVLDDIELCEMHDKLNTPSSALTSDRQFVTTFVDGDLITDLVVRDAGGHPTTLRELEQRRKAVEAAALEKGLDLNCEQVQKMIHEYDPVTPQHQGRKHKDEGNKAFKECDYAQASVHYTQAIDCLQVVADEAEGRDILATVYSNRSACSLKLGDHATALADANASLEIDPDHIKSNFRKGLALHAMGRYREACPVLGRALHLQPNNAQIKSALQFAERKAMLEGQR